MTRPNILFITSDQQRGDCYGFRGRNVQTPHLDILASEGTSLELSPYTHLTLPTIYSV